MASLQGKRGHNRASMKSTFSLTHPVLSPIIHHGVICMKQKPLDLILTDDNLSEYRFFLYTLPERYLGYKDDIGLYIFLNEKPLDVVSTDYYVEVWARVSYDPRVIWQVDSMSVAALDFEECGFQAILDGINNSEDFLPNLRQLIDMVERAKAQRERDGVQSEDG